ncbi:MAG: invertase protein [Candidatus Wolfebacteria bacterium GW2011_GWC2_46_275]|uniref:Site-specific recombinase, resolvase family n=1 Tax=Candidatus Wolfebacteria bacterium GW2011_GWB1_47_1 TaxID=1619007 RepID=A0A0G4ASN2_9BACT|nr:MAG: Putative site-specific recombinase, resolvase family [Candidatus Wolfebacteria bacterium GW2011_GWB1_47_1]KKU36437.1 MAG: invertase protein [Candidatus Wolfebacteria bacterium GW2011_GWC2_46_275]KKU41750.1 MAG: invertase protein [Candidatus Wolfebacteria bacterium GW2011_GWB2_46_69]KKU72102.1 MAG: invertase protein [Candidatus Wolfebacteria bacterium GW2011_GWB1_47_243]
MTQEINKITKLIAVYARVSTVAQEEEETIHTQLMAVHDFAEKNGYTIVKEYLDDGWSADILARPQLDQLRQDARTKMWEAVLIYDPDRLARKRSYQELVVDELLEAGIETLFVTVPPSKNEEDKVMQSMRAVFTEYEKMKIKERFRIGKLRKVKEGHILTSEAPYGYNYIKRVDNVHGYYEINEEETRVVKMIFDWVTYDKLTIRGIVLKLQELGIQPRKSKRGVWNTSTIGHLLRNTTYIGEACWGKSYAVVPERRINTEKYRRVIKTSRKVRPEEEWIKIPTPVIISAELFADAERQLKENFALSNRNRKNDYLLSGKIWCDCGNRRAGEGPQHGKHLYYRCTGRVHSFPLPNPCVKSGINARLSDELVWSKISELMSSPELLQEQIKNWSDNREDKAESSAIDIAGIKKQIAKSKEEEDRYNKAYGVGLFTVEQLGVYTTPLREKIDALERQVANVAVMERRVSNAELPSLQETEVFCENTRITLQDLNFEAKQAIVRNIIEKVVATKQELQVSGYIPVDNSNKNILLYAIDRHSRAAKRWQIDPL